ncbi:hypothetical protein O181_133240 [Austropuccinia psidii MF-1]|uniref:Uncharacterized protein n=1 Tax=Austropuccinia psidii MF-1 TaxID=1389203 RepID=A0A9Q3QDF5_9BASI|nr:hypothetical protein [Austropuccinia psidii MF-1]
MGIQGIQVVSALKIFSLFDLVTGYRLQGVERWNNTGEPIPVSGMAIYSSSDVPISRINEQGVVKWIRVISDSPTCPDAEGSDELDGEEVQLVNPTIGHPQFITCSISCP